MSYFLVGVLCMAAVLMMALANLLDQFYARNLAIGRWIRETLGRLDALDPDRAPTPPSRLDRLRERRRQQLYWLPYALFALLMLVALSFYAGDAFWLAFAIYRFMRRRGSRRVGHTEQA